MACKGPPAVMRGNHLTSLQFPQTTCRHCSSVTVLINASKTHSRDAYDVLHIIQFIQYVYSVSSVYPLLFNTQLAAVVC
jgi:hypothetical protein